MIAYHNDPAIKAAILEQLAAHRAADQLVKGQYWDGGKGCAIGCAIHSGFHSEYETRFGVPRILAHLEDRIFEGLPNDEAVEWPVRFMSVIRPGADLSLVWPRFALWLLTDGLSERNRNIPKVKAVADLYRQWTVGEKPSRRAWRAASAYTAAADAADAAAYAAAAAAAYAAYAAANAYADAAYAAAAAAANAAYAAANASAAAAAYSNQANKLIELLQAV